MSTNRLDKATRREGTWKEASGHGEFLTSSRRPCRTQAPHHLFGGGTKLRIVTLLLLADMEELGSGERRRSQPFPPPSASLRSASGLPFTYPAPEAPYIARSTGLWEWWAAFGLRPLLAGRLTCS
jgi:hypothetical protein